MQGGANGIAVVHRKNWIAACAYRDAVVAADLNFLGSLLHPRKIGDKLGCDRANRPISSGIIVDVRLIVNSDGLGKP